MTHMGKRRRSGASDAEVIEAYRATQSVYKVEKQTGVSATTIYRILALAGIERAGLAHWRRNAARFDQKTDGEIRRRYEAGEYVAKLAASFGASHHVIEAAIRRAGGTVQPVTPPLSDEEKAKIRALRAQGMSQFKIGIAIGRSQPSVGRFLRSEGEVFEPRRRERHGHWRGGSMIVGGYRKILLERDDPFFSMADVQGYVLEHRLILAKEFGRPLRKSETVHHINGDKLDNRPENLQLRQGKHGKHIAMRCLDCGSHRTLYT